MGNSNSEYREIPHKDEEILLKEIKKESCKLELVIKYILPFINTKDFVGSVILTNKSVFKQWGWKKKSENTLIINIGHFDISNDEFLKVNSSFNEIYKIKQINTDKVIISDVNTNNYDLFKNLKVYITSKPFIYDITLLNLKCLVCTSRDIKDCKYNLPSLEHLLVFSLEQAYYILSNMVEIPKTFKTITLFIGNGGSKEDHLKLFSKFPNFNYNIIFNGLCKYHPDYPYFIKFWVENRKKYTFIDEENSIEGLYYNFRYRINKNFITLCAQSDYSLKTFVIDYVSLL